MIRTNSQIINGFREEVNYLDIDEDKRRFEYFKNAIKSRSNKLRLQESKNQYLNKHIQLSQKYKNMDEHIISIEEFQKKFATNIKTGLTEEEAIYRLEKNGYNKQQQINTDTHWSILLLKQLINPFSLSLWVCVILAFVMYHLSKEINNVFLGVIIICIILINGFLCFAQKIKSRNLMETFKDFIPLQITVVRNGVQKRIVATKLVVGDVMKIQMGKKIPADIRIFQSQGLRINNSIFTGQTELIKKSPKCTNKDPLQTENLVYYPTLNGQGCGKGVVIATGCNTFMGSISMIQALAKKQKKIQKPSPIKQQINKIILRLAIFSLILAVIFLIIGFSIGYPVIFNLFAAVGIITANIPEGLSIQTTIATILTAKKLSKRFILAKTPDVIERLATVTCILSDKVRIITKDKMVTSHIWHGGKLCQAKNQQKIETKYQYDYDVNNLGFKFLQEVAVASSTANFDYQLPYEKIDAINNDKQLLFQQKQIKIKEKVIEWNQQLKNMDYIDMPTYGDVYQSGIIRFYQPIQDITKIRKKYSVVLDKYNQQFRTQFSYQRKYALAALKEQTDDSHFCYLIKGNPQKIWDMCDFINVDGKVVGKNQQQEQKFVEINKILLKNGQNVIAFAKCSLPKQQFPADYKFDINKYNIPKQFCFAGLISLIDPPRQQIQKSVLKSRLIGVKVLMFTENQHLVATAIAKKSKIITEETVNQISERTGRSFDECFNQSHAIVIHGDMITQMSLKDEGLPEIQKYKSLQKWLKKQQIVFARTHSFQKKVIIKCLQKAGQIVAVTGDWMNDSQAVKQADIGISVSCASDATKDAGDIVLLNDDFSSIVFAIEQGRKFYDNVKKSICYTLTSQASQTLPFIAFIIFQIPCPLNNLLVIYISFGNDFFSVISLMQQQQQIDFTTQPKQGYYKLIKCSLISQAYGFHGFTQFWGGLLSYLVVFNDFGFPPSQLIMIAKVYMTKSNAGDAYNPTHITFGNTYLQQNYLNSCPNQQDSNYQLVDWLYNDSSRYDLRNTMLKCRINNGVAVYSQYIDWGTCKIQQISPYTNLPVCFTTQAGKYAQTAYFIGIVWCQIFNYFVCRTRKQSVFKHGFTRPYFFISITASLLLLILVTFFNPLSIVFGTRDNIFMHYGIPALPFGIMMLLIDEAKKIVLRSLMNCKYNQYWFVKLNYW